MRATAIEPTQLQRMTVAVYMMATKRACMLLATRVSAISMLATVMMRVMARATNTRATMRVAVMTVVKSQHDWHMPRDTWHPAVTPLGQQWVIRGIPLARQCHAAGTSLGRHTGTTLGQYWRNLKPRLGRNCAECDRISEMLKNYTELHRTPQNQTGLDMTGQGRIGQNST